MLDINGVHDHRQRLLVLANLDETRSQVADKVHIEHFMALGLKLFQSSFQQRNPLAEIILKEQPPASQTRRDGTVWLQRIG